MDKSEQYSGCGDGSVADHDFLKWIWARLKFVYDESPEQSYMVRLVDIIEKMEVEAKPVVAAVKPPIGLRPRAIADRERAAEILCAIGRYSQAGKSVPGDWLSELSEVLR